MQLYYMETQFCAGKNLTENVLKITLLRTNVSTGESYCREVCWATEESGRGTLVWPGGDWPGPDVALSWKEVNLWRDGLLRVWNPWELVSSNLPGLGTQPASPAPRGNVFWTNLWTSFMISSWSQHLQNWEPLLKCVTNIWTSKKTFVQFYKILVSLLHLIQVLLHISFLPQCKFFSLLYLSV